MAKYLIQGSYTQQGLEGVLKEGGSGRIQAVKQVLADMGGTLEAFYFSFGADDFVLILDLPSAVDMTALSLNDQVLGGVKSRVTVLITPEEVDAAVAKTVHFRAPGK